MGITCCITLNIGPTSLNFFVNYFDKKHIIIVANFLIAFLFLLVNNAAFGWVGPVERQQTEHIKSMYATNVFGPITLITKLIPVWKKSGTGQAITISSLVGLMGFPFSSVYSSSKFAMEGFMETVQLELHGYPNIKYDLKPFF